MLHDTLLLAQTFASEGGFWIAWSLFSAAFLYGCCHYRLPL